MATSHKNVETEPKQTELKQSLEQKAASRAELKPEWLAEVVKCRDEMVGLNELIVRLRQRHGVSPSEDETIIGELSKRGQSLTSKLQVLSAHK